MKSYLRFVVLAVAAIALGAAFAFVQGKAPVATVSKTTSQPAAAMPGATVGGPFSMQDQRNNAVTEKSWPGKYKLVFFGYTHCPDTCPATLQKIAAVMQQVDPTGAKIVPLFVTVDPERDTPNVMFKYAATFSPLIQGLSGTEDQTKGMEQAYKVYAVKQPSQNKDDYAEYIEDHSAFVYVMSPDDKLLQTLAFDDTVETMVAKVKESVK